MKTKGGMVLFGNTKPKHSRSCQEMSDWRPETKRLNLEWPKPVKTLQQQKNMRLGYHPLILFLVIFATDSVSKILHRNVSPIFRPLLFRPVALVTLQICGGQLIQGTGGTVDLISIGMPFRRTDKKHWTKQCRSSPSLVSPQCAFHNNGHSMW